MFAYRIESDGQDRIVHCCDPVQYASNACYHDYCPPGHFAKRPVPNFPPPPVPHTLHQQHHNTLHQLYINAPTMVQHSPVRSDPDSGYCGDSSFRCKPTAVVNRPAHNGNDPDCMARCQAKYTNRCSVVKANEYPLYQDRYCRASFIAPCHYRCSGQFTTMTSPAPMMTPCQQVSIVNSGQFTTVIPQCCLDTCDVTNQPAIQNNISRKPCASLDGQSNCNSEMTGSSSSFRRRLSSPCVDWSNKGDTSAIVDDDTNDVAYCSRSIQTEERSLLRNERPTTNVNYEVPINNIEKHHSIF